MPDLGVAVVRQYESGAVFRLGKLRNGRKPGIRLMIPLVDRMTMVTLRTVTMPLSTQPMQRAMARPAEAEREKRAKTIAAEGKTLSARRPAEAADVIADHPVALQLRNPQIFAEIAAEKNSTIVFPSQFLCSVRALTRFPEQEGAGDGRIPGGDPLRSAQPPNRP